GGVVLVEIGLLQIVIDGIERRALLDLVALADIQLGHASGFVGADKDHVGFDPALIAGIPALIAAGERDCQRERRQNSQRCSRRSHAVLRSPKIRSRWTGNLPLASSGASLFTSPPSIAALIAGRPRTC